MTNIRAILIVILLTATSLFISLQFADLRMYRPQYSPASVERIALGQAKYPYQYRNLLPLTALKIHDLLSEQDSFASKVKEYCFIFESLFTYALLIAFWFYLKSFGFNRLHCLFGEGLLLLALIVTYLLPIQYPIYFICDIPSVFFFTIGLLMLRKKNWLVYYPLFIIATWNRETSCFITVAFLLSFWNVLDKRTLWLHCIAQIAIWFAVKTILLLVYDNQLESAFHNNFFLNIKYLITPELYPVLLSGVGYLWLPVAIGWKYLGSWNRSMVLLAAPFLAGMIIVGNLIEIRIFGELIPVFAAASLEIFTKAKSEQA